MIDLTHGIRRQDVMHGALVLERALGYAPAGVHVAVVDPGVGAERRAVALRTAEEGRLLVGPDNGLLMPAAARFGGVAEAVEISASPWRLEPVSATFHGRDLFAPVAARLAAGGALADAGEALDPAALVALALPWAEVAGATLRATVAGVDGFGNVSLYARGGDAGALGDGRAPGGRGTAGGRAPGAHGPHVRRRRARRPARPRGRRRPAGDRAQPGRRGGRARRRARRPRGGRAGVTLGRPRLHVRTIGSTNDRARELAAAGAPHGTLVTTGEQVAGRGRQGRTWSAPPGRALLMSLVLRTVDPLLPLRAGLAVADVAGPAARVKWPNDVLLDGRKLAGVLVEARPHDGWAVLGIGLNVAIELDTLPEDVRARAATLGRPPAALEATLDELLRALEARLAEPPRPRWPRCGSATRWPAGAIRWDGGEGVAAGIAGDGALLVRTADGEARLAAGEVHLAP